MSQVVDLAISAVTRISSFYQDINPSTLSGAIDIIIVKQENGDLLSSPFHVRFGKLKLLQPSDKLVEIAVNGERVDVVMKVGEAGEAFFVVDGGTDVPEELRTSPIVTPTKADQPDSLLLEGGLLDPTLPSTDSPIDAANETMDTALDTMSDSIIDTTLDTIDPTLTNLHIQDETESLDGQPSSYTSYSLSRHTLDTPTRHSHSQSATVDSRPSSPPWSWQWGGLPEREGKVLEGEKVDEMLASTKPPSAVTLPTYTSSGKGTASNDKRSTPERNVKKSMLARDQDLNLHWSDISKADDVQVSLAGPLDEFAKLDFEVQKVLFESNAVDEAKYLSNPAILSSPTVIVKINGYYHTWETACQIIMSKVLYGKELDQASLLKVFKKTKSGWFSWSKPEILSSPSLPNMKTPKVESPKKNYAKSLRLNSNQLKSLNLKPGCNDITFSVHTPLQGLATCQAHIFLWDYTTKIIVSDVDGTITKSDVLGHVFNMVGRDWTHPGVASLYTSIATNGYEFLYLTSRAIGQASSTRDYLSKVAQDTSTLPLGPLLLSPARLIQALRREVIERRPQEFKMSCLKDIKKLFGGREPFYAGFGNRITDAISYRSVGIPSSRIFTIDPNGVVQLELLANYVTSYVKLRETVDQVFPPTSVNDDYGDFKFWKNDDYSSVKIDIPEIQYSDSEDSDDEDINLKTQLAAMKHASY